MVGCPACGAINPADARWCNQCYQAIGAAPTGSAAPPSTGSATTARTAAPTAVPSSTVLRQREGRLEWSCGACGAINSVEHLRCPTCGAALIAPARGRSVPDWRTALLWSALVPGAGHVVAGRIGAGIARLVLFVVWLAGGLALALDGGRAVLAATPLLLGVLILWTTSVLDVLALSRGRQELLDGRVMLWLVVGVIALSLLGVAAGVAAR